MCKKVDERLPQNIGKGVLPDYPAVKSPWGKLVGYQEAMHYVSRYNAVISASLMQVLRILMPDYATRAATMCAEAYGRLRYIQQMYGEANMDEHNIHPFCRGNFVGALTGDSGDEALMMCGRCTDFGTYRVEKELDVCDWDIVGSELCRATTQSLEASCDSWADKLRKGPKLEYHMVEAKGCGDLHCRIVAESREKYPMPPHAQWECMGPVATADQIKFTTEDYLVKESMVFREECDYTFSNGTNMERDASSVATMLAQSSAALTYILPCMDMMVKQGMVEEKTLDHVIRCVCEAAGKAAFGECYAREGLRTWLGAPHDVDDGRLLGGHIEMYLQGFRVPYEIEAFNKDEVIYVIDTMPLSLYNSYPKHVDALKWTWYGMARTLINTQWFCWEEDSPAGKLRIKIAKKIDKFC